jgi:DNA-binding LacI/PurR family transcriptional regulator
MAQGDPPTLFDVSAASGLSVTTVSRAINKTGYVSAQSRERIEMAMRELGYVRNLAAKGLRTRKSHTVYCVFPEIDNPYFTGIYQGLDSALRREGYAVFLCQAGDLEPLVRSMAERGADGIVYDASYRGFPWRDGLLQGISLVEVNSPFRFRDEHSVRIDIGSALMELFSLLAQAGHNAVGLISYAGKTPNERLEAYSEAAERFGFSRDPGLVSLHDPAMSKHEIGYRGMRAILDAVPSVSAVMAENDPCAAGAFAAALSGGRRVPEDLSLVGFDDTPLGEFAPVPLTTVRLPAFAQGEAAAGMLLSLMRGEAAPGCVDLGYRLVRRKSVSERMP